MEISVTFGAKLLFMHNGSEHFIHIQLDQIQLM